MDVRLCECGCGSYLKGYQKYFASYGCRAKVKCGSGSPKWRGGKVKRTHGYIVVKDRSHSKADSNGYIYEHLVIAEKALGHPLPPKAQVHHWDEIKSNNSPSNLVICQDAAYHHLLHRRMRAFRACGNPEANKCYICKVYDMYTIAPKGRTRSYYHPECLRRHQIAYQARRRQDKKEVKNA